MKILDTLKKWSDVEIELVEKAIDLSEYYDRWIIRWYIFGSCDICCQAMGLKDKDFQYFYRETLKHIGIPNKDIEESIAVWMLDKIDKDELFFINEGAVNFREFKNKPDGVGGLNFCFLKLKKEGVSEKK